MVGRIGQARVKSEKGINDPSSSEGRFKTAADPWGISLCDLFRNWLLVKMRRKKEAVATGETPASDRASPVRVRADV